MVTMLVYYRVRTANEHYPVIHDHYVYKACHLTVTIPYIACRLAIIILKVEIFVEHVYTTIIIFKVSFLYSHMHSNFYSSASGVSMSLFS